jgi:hypothetical protein
MSDKRQKWTFLTIPVSETMETEKARRLDIDMPDNSLKFVRLPKSQTQEFVKRGDEVSLWLADWLVTEKELTQFVDTSFEPTLF